MIYPDLTRGPDINQDPILHVLCDHIQIPENDVVAGIVVCRTISVIGAELRVVNRLVPVRTYNGLVVPNAGV